jgi:mRNA-degrading endonuclease RelE of RelBE toxin-antitoxin system
LPSYEILLSATAKKQLRDIPADHRRRVVRALQRLGDDPIAPRPGADIRKLWQEGDLPMYRLRIDAYRVLNFVVGREVRVTRVARRPVAYRGLD